MARRLIYKGLTVAELAKEKGIPQLAGRLAMSQQAVLYWLSFETAPSVLTAAKIIHLSNGRCTFASIYAPYVNNYFKKNPKEPSFEQLELFKD